MFFATITLLTALAMAGTAAWFAIAGIMSVFAGAAIPALIMGAVIETGKVVGISWIYRNWKEKTSIKFFMLPAVIVAMFLTSMGIFGFLSKAHLEQNAPVSNNVAQIERLDQRIAREKSKIIDAETVIAQLDETVNTLIAYDKISGPEGARAVRESQQAQRDQLSQIINEAEDAISEYEDQKFELSQQLREIELEIGPIKYIAELIYDEPTNKVEDAVRYVIIAFIFVFDPMAILLLMAANHSLMRIKEQKTKTLSKDNEPNDESKDEPSDDFEDVEETYEPEEVEEVDENSEETPGKQLLELFDEETQQTEEHIQDEEEVNELNNPPDREWLRAIPQKDEEIDEKTMRSVMQRLKDRDLTRDEERLLQRFRKLAASRNIPWDVARRASVTTNNPLLKD